MRLPGAHRFGRRLADVERRVEVGLPDLEVDDGATLPLERLRLREHAERRLRSEALEARCKPGCDGDAHPADLETLTPQRPRRASGLAVGDAGGRPAGVGVRCVADLVLDLAAGAEVLRQAV